MQIAHTFPGSHGTRTELNGFVIIPILIHSVCCINACVLPETVFKNANISVQLLHNMSFCYFVCCTACVIGALVIRLRLGSTVMMSVITCSLSFTYLFKFLLLSDQHSLQ